MNEHHSNLRPDGTVFPPVTPDPPPPPGQPAFIVPDIVIPGAEQTRPAPASGPSPPTETFVPPRPGIDVVDPA